MKVRFLSIADRELLDAFQWYESQQAGLGYALIDEVDLCVHRIIRYPGGCPDRGDGIRRALINRFPYGLWYVAGEGELLVYAVAHLHRQPRYWASRLRKDGPSRSPTS